jgi:hypothetical protein
VPGWLAEIIEKLHAKDPAERFQSATEVAELLSQHLAHCQQPLAVPKPPPLRYRSPAARATRRRFVWIATAALLLLAAGAGTAGLVHWATQPRAGGSIAVRGSPDPLQPLTEGLQNREERTASVIASAGSESRAERSSQTRTERTARAGAASSDDAVSRWDPLPGEIEGLQRDLGKFEAHWQTPPGRETTIPADPLPEIRSRLDNLEMQLQADGP